MQVTSVSPNFIEFHGYILNTNEIEAIVNNPNEGTKKKYPTLIRMRSGKEYKFSKSKSEAARQLRLNFTGPGPSRGRVFH